MKRYVLIIGIFALIAVVITGILIGVSNNKAYSDEKNANAYGMEDVNNLDENNGNANVISGNTPFASSITPTIKTVVNKNEKTLDLYGTYDENDIIIESAIVNIAGTDVKYPQISGLKDKNVQNKINNKIREKVVKKYEDFAKNGELINAYSSYNVGANFSNTLSISLEYRVRINNLNNEDGQNIVETIGLNYELINGNELKFEDLFKEGEDVSIFPRMALYKQLVIESRGNEGDYYTDLHYDNEKKMWIAEHNYVDNYVQWNVKTEEVEYVPTMTDYDIEKAVKKFMKSDEKNFYYDSRTLYMSELGWINLYDIPDKVVIYDKYLTNKELYENNNIGRKGVINCSAEINMGKYKETKYYSDNLFYDIDAVVDRAQFWKYESTKSKEYIDNRLREEANILKAEMEKYKKIALDNPNKAYFVFLETDLLYGMRSEKKDSETIYIPNNIIQLNKKNMVFSCDIQEKKKMLDEILSGYRYYNIGFYGSIFDYLRVGGRGGTDAEHRSDVEFTSETHYYNIFNNEEITLEEGIFIDGVDYESILKPLTKYPNDDFEYKFDLNEIKMNSKNHSDDDYYYRPWSTRINYTDIEQYVIVRDVHEYILPDSSTGKYNKFEIEALTDEQLNIAYNEPFARHGHDFQTKSLKDWFGNWEWYKPVSGKVVGLEELNEIEKYNVELIREVINERA